MYIVSFHDLLDIMLLNQIVSLRWEPLVFISLNYSFPQFIFTILSCWKIFWVGYKFFGLMLIWFFCLYNYFSFFPLILFFFAGSKHWKDLLWIGWHSGEKWCYHCMHSVHCTNYSKVEVLLFFLVYWLCVL